jgi:hypothetical protein
VGYIHFAERTLMPKTINLDLERVEHLAAQGLSQGQAAERLGIKPGTFATKMSKEPELKAAWKRGRATFEKPSGNGHMPSTASGPIPASQFTKDEVDVLEALYCFDGAEFDDILRESGLERDATSRALRILCQKNLAYSAPDSASGKTKFYAVGDARQVTLGPAPVPAPVTPEVVGTSRTEETVTRMPRTQKRQKQTSTALATRQTKRTQGKSALPSRTRQQSAIATSQQVIDVEPVAAVPDGAQSLPAHRALEGAAIELSFMRHHGCASNKYEEVMKEIAEAMRD